MRSVHGESWVFLRVSVSPCLRESQERANKAVSRRCRASHESLFKIRKPRFSREKMLHSAALGCLELIALKGNAARHFRLVGCVKPGERATATAMHARPPGADAPKCIAAKQFQAVNRRDMTSAGRPRATPGQFVSRSHGATEMQENEMGTLIEEGWRHALRPRRVLGLSPCLRVSVSP